MIGICCFKFSLLAIPFFYEPNCEETLVYEVSANDTTELLTLLSEIAFSNIAVYFDFGGRC